MLGSCTHLFLKKKIKHSYSSGTAEWQDLLQKEAYLFQGDHLQIRYQSTHSRRVKQNHKQRHSGEECIQLSPAERFTHITSHINYVEA